MVEHVDDGQDHELLVLGGLDVDRMGPRENYAQCPPQPVKAVRFGSANPHAGR